MSAFGARTSAVLAAAIFAMTTVPSQRDAFAGAPLLIKIGVDLPLSGIDGASALPVRNAALLAVEEANRRGFPGGARVEIDDLDDAVQGKHDPAQGAQNLRTFASDDAVVAALGPMNSNVAEAEIPISNGIGLAQITPAASAIELTRGPNALRLRPEHPDRPAFFRVCASDDVQGGAAAEYARRLHLSRAFVIDDNESYGKGIADVFASEFPKRGGTIVGREHLTAFQLDYKPLLTKVSALHPDAIFFGGIVSTGGALLRKQMADVGLGRVPYFGGDGLSSPEFVPLAGASAEGTYFTLTSPDVRRLPAAGAFVAAYRARFHADPGSYSAGAYAATLVELTAIRGALGARPGRLPDRGDILNRVAHVRLPVTPIGSVAFDPSGDVLGPIVSLYQVSGGRIRFVEQTHAGAK